MRKRHAFTLVELMVAISVTAVLVTMMVSLVSSVSNAWQRGDAQAETHSAGRGALNLLSRELQGAVVDLDLGFKIQTVNGMPNQFALKFLTRSEPKGTDQPSVRKVCYQMAWADQRIIPHIKPKYDDSHKVPVLVRMESSNLDDVFVVTKAADIEKWTNDFGNIPADGISPALQASTEHTEVAAENVLGWRVTPLYWDAALKQTVPDKTDKASKYYNLYLTSEKAPRALEIELISVATRPAAKGAAFPDWADLFTYPWLFETHRTVEDAGTDVVPPGPFTTLLRQHATIFSATVYLQSKTP